MNPNKSINPYLFLPVKITNVESVSRHNDATISTLRVVALKKDEPRFNGNVEFFVEGDFSSLLGEGHTVQSANQKLMEFSEDSSRNYSKSMVMINGNWSLMSNEGSKFTALSHVLLENYLDAIKNNKRDERPDPQNNKIVNGDFIKEFLTSSQLRTSKLFVFNGIKFNKFSENEVDLLLRHCGDSNKSNLVLDLSDNPNHYKFIKGMKRESLPYFKQLFSRQEFHGALSAYVNMRILGLNEENSINLINRYGLNALPKLKSNPFAIKELSLDEKILVTYSLGGEVDQDLINYSSINEAINEMTSTGSTAFPIDSNWRRSIKAFKHSILYKIVNKQNAKVPDIWTKNPKDVEAIDKMVKKALGSLRQTLEKHQNAFKKISYAKAKDGSGLREVESMDAYRASHIYDSTYITSKENYQIEQSIVANLKRLVANGYSPMPENTDLVFDIDPYTAQRNAVRQSLEYKVSIITGGPGVGKTTVLESVLKTLEATSNKKLVVKLVAPTGKAASRMSDSTKRDASTIHTLLKYNDKNGFQLNKDNQLDADIMVIDEASMVDAEVFNDLLSSLKSHTKLIIIGDKDQLPSVGPGAILQELIRSKVIPFTVLNEAKRQGANSGIVRYAYQIIKNQMPDLNEINRTCNDLFFIEANSDEEIKKRINNLVGRELPERNVSMEDVQLLAPRSDFRGQGITSPTLNRSLRFLMNKSGGPKLDQKHWNNYQYGDRIICNINDSKLGISNGHQGRIVGVDNNNGTVSVAFEHLEEGEVLELDQKYLCDGARFDLSYCMTIHKSQGSEYPVVIIPLSENPSDMYMLNAQLVYTAMTRGKKEVYFVGSAKALESAVRKTVEVERSSVLSKILQTELPQLPEHLVNSEVEIVLGSPDDNAPVNKQPAPQPKVQEKQEEFDVPYY